MINNFFESQQNNIQTILRCTQESSDEHLYRVPASHSTTIPTSCISISRYAYIMIICMQNYFFFHFKLLLLLLYQTIYYIQKFCNYVNLFDNFVSYVYSNIFYKYGLKYCGHVKFFNVKLKTYTYFSITERCAIFFTEVKTRYVLLYGYEKEKKINLFVGILRY